MKRVHPSHDWTLLASETRCARCRTGIDWPLAEQKCTPFETTDPIVREKKGGAQMIDHIGIVQMHVVRLSGCAAEASIRTVDACETRTALTISEAIDSAYRACVDLDYREESRCDRR